MRAIQSIAVVLLVKMTQFLLAPFLQNTLCEKDGLTKVIPQMRQASRKIVKIFDLCLSKAGGGARGPFGAFVTTCLLLCVDVGVEKGEFC